MLLYSPPAEQGKVFTDFSLPTVNGDEFNTAQIPQTHGVVLMFICNHCPYVKAIEDRLLELGREFKDKALTFIAICANDPSENPEDQPEELRKRAEEKNYPFVYLVDADQQVAKTYGAVCTPDFFVFAPTSKGREIYYRGRLDDSWKDPSRVTQREMAEALTQLLEKKPAPQKQIPSMGCSIKWREEAH